MEEKLLWETKQKITAKYSPLFWSEDNLNNKKTLTPHYAFGC